MWDVWCLECDRAAEYLSIYPSSLYKGFHFFVNAFCAWFRDKGVISLILPNQDVTASPLLKKFTRLFTEDFLGFLRRVSREKAAVNAGSQVNVFITIGK